MAARRPEDMPQQHDLPRQYASGPQPRCATPRLGMLSWPQVTGAPHKDLNDIMNRWRVELSRIAV
jgi:hypothetical protein